MNIYIYICSIYAHKHIYNIYLHIYKHKHIYIYYIYICMFIYIYEDVHRPQSAMSASASVTTKSLWGQLGIHSVFIFSSNYLIYLLSIYTSIV